MFNLLYGLLSLTDQIENDFAALHDALAALRPVPAAARAGRAKKPAAGKRGRPAAKKPSRGGDARKARR
jgi:hypothetical protein